MNIITQFTMWYDNDGKPRLPRSPREMWRHIKQHFTFVKGHEIWLEA